MYIGGRGSFFSREREVFGWRLGEGASTRCPEELGGSRFARIRALLELDHGISFSAVARWVAAQCVHIWLCPEKDRLVGSPDALLATEVATPTFGTARRGAEASVATNDEK